MLSDCAGRARISLSAFALFVAVAGCESVEVVETPPPVVEVEETPDEAPAVLEPVVAEPPSGGLIVRLHAQSDAEMPVGATAVVTLRSADDIRSAELVKGERLVRFDAVESGRYDLSVTVNSDGFEVGSYDYFVDVTDALGDVTARIDYVRADLVVESDIETSLERSYLGTASIGAGACADFGTSGAVRSELHLATDGDRMDLTIENFQRDSLRLSGRVDPGATPLSAAGAFQSSGGQSGDWEMTHLTAPTPGAILAVIAFDDRTRSCQATLEFAGLVEGRAASGTVGLNEVGVTVELAGHGRTQRVTLGRGESVARFDGLLLGQYDIFVEVRQGGRIVDTRQESVEVTPEGARAEPSFAIEWAVADASPLMPRDDYERLGHAFVGKSVVARGEPGCVGSIPLVDTTGLTAVTPDDGAIRMTFDSFYGRVLELTGDVLDGREAFAASGTYRSSDDKNGSWTIDRLAAPTSRSVAMLVEFDNRTDACRATYEFAGVR